MRGAKGARWAAPATGRTRRPGRPHGLAAVPRPADVRDGSSAEVSTSPRRYVRPTRASAMWSGAVDAVDADDGDAVRTAWREAA